jgi:hypothetical protein
MPFDLMEVCKRDGEETFAGRCGNDEDAPVSWRSSSLFEAIAASGVERLPAERRYARCERSLRDGITVDDRDWATLQELLA